MSNIRQRKPATDGDDKHEDSRQIDDEIQPDSGWSTFLRVAVFVFVCLPVMFLLRMIFLVDSPINPVIYTLPAPPKLEGVLAPNDLLVFQGRRFYENKIKGPESLIYQNGHIYTGTHDGKILHIDHNKGVLDVVARLGKPPCGPAEYEHRCGRPLGMRFDSDGYLVVVDGYLGMYKVNVATGDVHQLFPSTMKVNNQKFMLLNDMDIAPDGMIYFTDSSSKYDRRNRAYAVLEGSANGRLLRHDPVNNVTEMLLDKLYFANGVQVSKDGSYLLVAEGSMSRILKYHLTGPKKGQSEMFAENLPGFVDNIRRSSSGGYWVALPYCRSADHFSMMDAISQYPSLRKQMAKIPLYYMSIFEPTCTMIVELNTHGEIVRSLMDLSGERFQFISEVEDNAGTLYLGSFTSPYIGVVNTMKKPNDKS